MSHLFVMNKKNKINENLKYSKLLIDSLQSLLIIT